MSRVQLALNVDDIEEAVSFYSKLFGTEPAKRRPGYANFAVAEPPLKLVLLENPGQGGSLNHLGVEVADTGAVDAEQNRLAAAGLAAIDERDTTCCYARQDKFWVTGAPNGERWEIYTVLQDSATFWGQDDEQRWQAVETELVATSGGQATQCCGGPRAASGEETGSSDMCCAQPVR
jgi:catechol 2,3-dioxygenase-like lactoylglutathione lyase family enzyme